MVPRAQVFDPTEVGVYHCFSQCVRQLFLLGHDRLTATHNGHRRDLAVGELRRLAGVMGVEVLDFALMENHVHCILRNRPDVVGLWPDREVAVRWWALCPGRRNRDGSAATATEEELEVLLRDGDWIAERRERLSHLSWFMWFWLGKIAKTANQEDGKRGHFFASRFKCKRLADEGALLACSMYTVLNPLRAGLTTEVEGYVHTSLSARVAGHMRRSQRALGQEVLGDDPDTWLAELFLDERAAAAEPTMNPYPAPRLTEKGYLPVTLPQYLELARWTGQQSQSPAATWGAAGSMPESLASMLGEVGLAPELWVDTVVRFEQLFHYVVGSYEHMTKAADRLSQGWLQGVRACAQRWRQQAPSSPPGTESASERPDNAPY